MSCDGPAQEAALSYAARGWPVIPIHWPSPSRCSCGRANCASIGKHPRTEHGLKDATIDAELIRRWWQRWPQTNVAIMTGAPSGLLVVDIDPRNGGDGQWQKLVAEHGAIETLTAVTGGGGLHLYLRRPDGDLRKQLASGIDLQGDGRYVVAPPSLHFSGERYQFIDPNLPVAECPPWLAALVQKPRPRAPSAGGIVDLSQVRAAAYAKAALEHEAKAVAKAREGTRNDQLNSSAFAIGQLLDHIAEDQAQSVLLQAACEAGLTETEAQRTIASGFAAGRREPRPIPERTRPIDITGPVRPPDSDDTDDDQPRAEDGEDTDRETRRPSIAVRLVQLVDPEALFCDERGDGYIHLVRDAHRALLRLRSRNFRAYLADQLFTLEERVPGSEAISAALSVLEARARRRPCVTLWNRVARGLDGAI